MLKKTLSMHMVQTLHFSTSQKSLGPSAKGRKHFSPWLVWVTINLNIHRSLSVSWYLLQLLSSLAWDKRFFMVSMGLTGSVISHKMQTSLPICSQQKLQNRIKNHPDFSLNFGLGQKIRQFPLGCFTCKQMKIDY